MPGETGLDDIALTDFRKGRLSGARPRLSWPAWDADQAGTAFVDGRTLVEFRWQD